MTKLAVTIRKIDLPNDRDIVIELHCRSSYASETPYGRKVSYEEYRQKWLTTSQPESFLSDLVQTQADDRTIAEVWEVDGDVGGYLWMTFMDLVDYDLVIADINELGVLPEFQHRGIGTEMLNRAEEHAQNLGVTLLRVCTGIENLPAQSLYETLGFQVYNITYEKVLR